MVGRLGMMKRFNIRITEKEHLYLINTMGNRSVTTDFGPSGVFVTERSEEWVIREIAKLRGILPKSEVMPTANG